MPTPIEALDYDLPADRIATEPAEPRDAARLMVVHRATGRIEHRRVRDLPELVGPSGPLRPGDLMVFNQTRVLPARIAGLRRGTGGRVGGLFLRAVDPQTWEVMLEARGSLGPGEAIDLEPGSHLELLAAQGRGNWLARLHSPHATLALLDRIGSTPLPPYIVQARKTRAQAGTAGDSVNTPATDDPRRYNTVYARDPGSVAAPTAGLHFTDDLLARLDARGLARAAVTLHVGLGTFAPVRSDTLEGHVIHAESLVAPAAAIAALRAARARGGRILAVGTTTVRALESLPASEPAGPDVPPSHDFAGDTGLFITPGFSFRFADLLMTNFHLPRSTLLALVAAMPGVGFDNLKRWYAVAVAEGYRFYSYGDAMLLA
ncbi:MAG: tRNA preQ1(34) S-adenosylmethionine ribosyltransferase-isomerase QueA [Planctomycetota bacterium]|nr:tRNA preQ1(34) S-adenosylmethionine ribosyltransferase-isomerase QueA [Planctomycetota bacterium]